MFFLTRKLNLETHQGLPAHRAMCLKCCKAKVKSWKFQNDDICIIDWPRVRSKMAVCLWAETANHITGFGSSCLLLELAVKWAIVTHNHVCMSCVYSKMDTNTFLCQGLRLLQSFHGKDISTLLIFNNLNLLLQALSY